MKPKPCCNKLPLSGETSAPYTGFFYKISDLLPENPRYRDRVCRQRVLTNQYYRVLPSELNRFARKNTAQAGKNLVAARKCRAIVGGGDRLLA